MPISRSILMACGALSVVVLAGLSARAEDTDSTERLKAALRKVTSELRAEQDQNAALSVKQAHDAQAVSDLTAQVDALRKKNDVLQKQSDTAAAEAQSNASQLAQTQSALDQWKDAYQKAAETARARDAAAKSFEVQSNGLSRRVDLCEGKNAELYATGKEILDKLDSDDFAASLVRHEPFTGIARVKLDNIVQDYQDKLRDQRLPPPVPRTKTQ